jgi:hypothetical protein
MTVGAPPSPPSSPPSCGLGSAYGGCATRAGGEFFFEWDEICYNSKITPRVAAGWPP